MHAVYFNGQTGIFRFHRVISNTKTQVERQVETLRRQERVCAVVVTGVYRIDVVLHQKIITGNLHFCAEIGNANAEPNAVEGRGENRAEIDGQARRTGIPDFLLHIFKRTADGEFIRKTPCLYLCQCKAARVVLRPALSFRMMDRGINDVAHIKRN